MLLGARRVHRAVQAVMTPAAVAASHAVSDRRARQSTADEADQSGGQECDEAEAAFGCWRIRLFRHLILLVRCKARFAPSLVEMGSGRVGGFARV